MIPIKAFDRIDHLMIEVDDPQAAYGEFQAVFSLPQAWPVTETEDYTSVGIHFGNVNIELIHFRRRFGLTPAPYTGFGGVCLTSRFDMETIRAELAAHAVTLLDGEDAPGHRTSVLASKEPQTIFLCEYKFDTTDWRARLRDEFEASRGGTLRLAHVEEVGIAHRLLATHEFLFESPDSVRLRYSETPQVRLKSMDTPGLGETVLLGETVFSFR